MEVLLVNNEMTAAEKALLNSREVILFSRGSLRIPWNGCRARLGWLDMELPIHAFRRVTNTNCKQMSQCQGQQDASSLTQK